MDKFLGLNNERQAETPSDFSGSEAPVASSSKSKRNQKDNNKSVLPNKKLKTAATPKEQWRTIYNWLDYRNVDGKVLIFCT